MTLRSQQASQQQPALPSAVPKATVSDTTAQSAEDDEGTGILHFCCRDWHEPLM